MNRQNINILDPVIRVHYHKDKLKSFLTQRNDLYSLYYKLGNNKWYNTRSITKVELEEIIELLKSPIEKITTDQLEQF